ncbi:MAG: ABC-type transport auxiliary lipoprotein family protein [Pseudomonadota bacterium]
MIKLNRRAFTSTAAGGVALALAGCSGTLLSRPTPPDLYTLTPKSTFSPSLPTVNWQLLVEEPVAPAGLNTTRIAISPDLIEIDYYAGVAWTDRAPAMVLTLLIESFQNTDRIVAVGRDVSGLRADYRLQTELREFQAEPQPDGTTLVEARLNARLVRMPDRLIFASGNFPAVSQAASNSFSDVLIAFDDALGDTMGDVVEWTLINGQADWPTNTRFRR